MKCLKVVVNNTSESKEAQELFSELGYRKDLCLNTLYPKLVVTSLYGCSDWYSTGADVGTHHDHKEITLLQLKDMVVLKRNSDSDATHIDSNNYGWFIASDQKCYRYQGGIWVYQPYVDFFDLKPINKSMKEYLTKMEDGSYKLVPSYMGDGDIEIPEGADLYVYFEEYNNTSFYKCDFDAIWQDDRWDYDMDDYKTYCKKEGKVLWSRNNNDYDELEKQTDIRFANGHNLDIFGAYHSFRQRVDGESDQNYREELLSFAKGYLSPNNESNINKEENKVKMKSVVHKYPIPFQEGFELNLPRGSQVVRIDTVDGFNFLWALHEVSDDPEIVTYKFVSSKTGGEIEHEKPLTFVGMYSIFIQMELLLYVFIEDIVDSNGNSIISEYDKNQSTCWRG